MRGPRSVSFSLLFLALSEAAKGPGDSSFCDSSSEASIISFAHSIKKFTSTCVSGGFPNCEDVACMKMQETFVKDKCHALVMKCANDPTCAFHSQAVPYSHYIGGTQTTCAACTSNPSEVLEKMEANTKRAAAVCKFDSLDEPQTHTQCQTKECHTAMKSVQLKCMTAWVRGFSWVPTVTDATRAKIGAYTKASIACDPKEAAIQFASSIASRTPISSKSTHSMAYAESTQVPLAAESVPGAEEVTREAQSGLSSSPSGTSAAPALPSRVLWVVMLFMLSFVSSTCV